MKIVQWILAVIGGIALLILAAGLVLPSTFSVQRSVEINASPRKVYDLVVEPRRWKDWSVWTHRDPDMRITYGGPPFGMGAKWSWVSKTEGTGSMEFTRVEPDRAVEYALSFPEYGMKSAGALKFEPAGNATRVTWTNSGDVGGNPLKHYLALMMDRMVGPDFEAGLANLKALAEKQ
jgi:uncharacterized protein YndB with AHSA1/START domain